MTTAPNLILVEISPTRHQLLVLRHGQVLAHRVERIEPAQHTAGVAPAAGALPQRRWAEQLTSFQAVLAQWVEELELVGRSASVVYSGPDSTASVYSVPAATGPVAGRAAAELAVSEAAAFPLESAATDIHLLRIDSTPGINADGSPRPPQMHHLAAIDSEASLASVCRCVENAGLLVQRTAPGSAAMLGAAWAIVESMTTDQHACAVLWLGEHGSTFVAGTSHRLAIARYLPHGIEHLIDALVRAGSGRTPSHASSGADAPATRADLRAALRSHGICDGIPPLNPATDPPHLGAIAIPLIRPVLQRLAIEIKQSVRFGLGAPERTDIQVLLAGPGARIPRLDSVLAADAGVPISSLPEPTDHSSTDAGPVEGESASFIAARSVPLSLLPRSRREAARFVGLRRAMRIGAAIAILASLADAAHHYAAVRDQSAILAQLQREQSTPSAAREAMREAAAARVGITQAQSRLRHLLPDAPSAAALLSLLSDATPDDVRLRSIELGPDRGGWSARINGIITSRRDASIPPAETLRRFLDQLTAAPIVAGSTLGPTHTSVGAESSQLMFEASINLVGLANEPLRAAIAGLSDPTHAPHEAQLADTPDTGVHGGAP